MAELSIYTLTDEQIRELYGRTKDRAVREMCINAVRATTASPQVQHEARCRIVELIREQNNHG